jgi:hypothetical protein
MVCDHSAENGAKHIRNSKHTAENSGVHSSFVKGDDLHDDDEDEREES